MLDENSGNGSATQEYFLTEFLKRYNQDRTWWDEWYVQRVWIVDSEGVTTRS